jgi:hypothetical protein
MEFQIREWTDNVNRTRLRIRYLGNRKKPGMGHHHCANFECSKSAKAILLLKVLNGCYDIIVPHGLGAMVFAMLATAPWIRWSSRFSLRTLLIATTLVALVLGLIVWAARK